MVHDLEGREFIRAVEALAAQKRSFVLSPDHWRTSRVTVDLNWRHVRFDAANKNLIPKKKGIYAFIVKHENNHFPHHGYIMYVGITGSTSGQKKFPASNRTLRDRFSDYIHERKKNKRPKVYFMLNKYEQDLFFYFVPFDDEDGIDLSQLEIDLNDALMPPVSQKDLSAEIRAKRDAIL